MLKSLYKPKVTKEENFTKPEKLSELSPSERLTLKIQNGYLQVKKGQKQKKIKTELRKKWKQLEKKI